MAVDITGPPTVRTAQVRRSLIAGVFVLAALLIGAGFVTLEGDPSSRDDAGSGAAAASTTSTAIDRQNDRVVGSAQPLAVYLVDSAEDAVELQNRMSVLTSDGLATDASVLVAGALEDDARVSNAIRDLRRQYGVDGVSVFDLRRPSVARAGVGAPTCGATVSADTVIGAC